MVPVSLRAPQDFHGGELPVRAHALLDTIEKSALGSHPLSRLISATKRGIPEDARLDMALLAMITSCPLVFWEQVETAIYAVARWFKVEPTRDIQVLIERDALHRKRRNNFILWFGSHELPA